MRRAVAEFPESAAGSDALDGLVQQFGMTSDPRTQPQRKTPLRIRGGGSKDFYGKPLQGEILDTRAYRGIVDYEPTELVITARAGTPLAEIEAALREQGQMLAFEPPHFGGSADRRRLRRRRPLRARAAPMPARCATSCSACACSTARATICASAAR